MWSFTELLQHFGNAMREAFPFPKARLLTWEQTFSKITGRRSFAQEAREHAEAREISKEWAKRNEESLRGRK